MRPLVSIVILNWNRKDLIRNCLQSIQETDYPNYEIIVIDQGSSDGSVDMLERDFPGIILLRNKKNVGYANGKNQGFRKARGKYIYMLDNDTLIVHKEWLSNVVKVAESDDTVSYTHLTLPTTPYV